MKGFFSGRWGNPRVLFRERRRRGDSIARVEGPGTWDGKTMRPEGTRCRIGRASVVREGSKSRSEEWKRAGLRRILGRAKADARAHPP